MYTKQQIQALQAKLNAVMAEFAAENNLVAGSSRVKYGADDFKVEVSFSNKDSNPHAVDPRFKVDLQRRGFMHGLTIDMIGKEVVLPSSRSGLSKFTFQGMRASKAVFKSGVDGKDYLFNADVAAKYLKPVGV